MRRFATVVTACALLGACTPAQLQLAQSDFTTGVKDACVDVNAAANLPGANPDIKLYADAACPLGIAAADLVQDSATVQWLGTIQGQLAAAKAAPAPAAPAPAPAAATS